MTMEREELHDLLERLWDRYDREEFISADPIAVPHCFASRDDREIAGFLAATIAWGSRPMIVRNGLRMMHFLDDAPHDFVRNASERELAKLSGFVHRTFNGGDLIQFVRSIRAICERHGGLGRFVEASYASTGDMRRVLAAFREEFFRTEHPERCRKHVSSIERGASCKRLCMYFRWMVRHDDRAWISVCGARFRPRRSICRSTCIPATWAVRWGCSRGGRTTGGPSRRSPRRCARSTPTTLCGTTSRCSARGSTDF